MEAGQTESSCMTQSEGEAGKKTTLKPSARWHLLVNPADFDAGATSGQLVFPSRLGGIGAMQPGLAEQSSCLKKPRSAVALGQRGVQAPAGARCKGPQDPPPKVAQRAWSNLLRSR